eukprot:9603277-Lingulodinium_polyedra.AAC.1
MALLPEEEKRGILRLLVFLFGSGAAVFRKPRPRTGRRPHTGKAKMAMGTAALLFACWMPPLGG